MANQKQSRERNHCVFVPMFSLSTARSSNRLLGLLSRPQLFSLARKLNLNPAQGLARPDLIQLFQRRRIRINQIRETPQTSNSQIGFLMLERTIYDPQGTEVSAEVVKSVFLAPGAEVELTKKTWSKTSTEFLDATEQVRNEERESALSANKEISESVGKQNQHSMNLGASVQAEGKFGVYSFSGTIQSNLAAARTESSNETTKALQDLTSKAAARMKTEHKISYTQRTEFSSEFSYTEKVKNPNTSHSVEISLQKVLQKWEVRHEQYGVRLCIDVMVKNPGRNLRADAIPRFFDPDAIDDPNPINPPPNAPPVPAPVIEESKEITFSDGRSSKVVAFSIPDGYEIDYMTAVSGEGWAVTFSELNGQPGFIRANQLGLRFYEGRYLGHHVNNYDAGAANSPTTRLVNVTCFFRRTAAALRVWVDAARPALIEQELRRWNLQNAERLAQQAQMESQSTAPPNQILRKEERDELCGAAIRFVALGEDTPQPTGVDEVLQVNPSLIRGLHQSFEWESMGVFLYPYWWDTSVFENVPGGPLTLSHKDFLRREFVRASWARVMIPVRFGFERYVLELLYGEEMRQAIANNQVNLGAPIGPLVRALNDIEALEAEGGDFGLGVENVDGQDRVLPPEPKVLATWPEYGPTDEVHPIVKILENADGQLVDIAEPYLRQSQDAQIQAFNSANDLRNLILEKSRNEGFEGELKVSIEGNKQEIIYKKD